jgi:four helix bundle protein
MDGAMEIYAMTKAFPSEEKYSLVDQIRRSSRSVAANLAEAWRKRRYEAAFKSKLNDAEAEASETQTWLKVALRCSYIDKRTADKLDQKYEHILTRLVAGMQGIGLCSSRGLISQSRRCKSSLFDFTSG